MARHNKLNFYHEKNDSFSNSSFYELTLTATSPDGSEAVKSSIDITASENAAGTRLAECAIPASQEESCLIVGLSSLDCSPARINGITMAGMCANFMSIVKKEVEA